MKQKCSCMYYINVLFLEKIKENMSKILTLTLGVNK